MIRLDAVSKSFGDIRALGGISFVVPDAQITGLLGPNGAGKTTALRIVYGVLRPDSGVASVDGIDLAADRIGAQRRLGVFPHAQGLYTIRLTAREHILYFGQMHGLSGDALCRRADELLAALGMTQGKRENAPHASGRRNGRDVLEADGLQETIGMQPIAGSGYPGKKALRVEGFFFLVKIS